MATLLDTLPDYQAALEAQKWSDRAIDTYLRELRRVGRAIACDVAQIDARMIESYQISRRHLSASSLRKTLSAIRSWARWAVKLGLIGSDPSESLLYPKKPEAAPRALTSEQLATLEQWLDQPADGRVAARDQLAVLLMLYGGLRLAECAGLRWSDIDLAAKTLWVRSGKGGKDRMIPIHHRLGDRLASVPKSQRTGTVLKNQKGGQLPKNTLSQTFWRRLAAYGLDVTAHQLRHTFASQLLNRGADLLVISQLLGHNSLETTKRYLMLETSKKTAAIEHLPDRF